MSEPSRSLVVDVLYFEGCPNYPGAAALAERVSAELGIDTQVRLLRISGPEAAIRARFLGSPVIRVNGRDIEPDADRGDGYVPACRRYQGGTACAGCPTGTGCVRRCSQRRRAHDRSPPASRTSDRPAVAASVLAHRGVRGGLPACVCAAGRRAVLLRAALGACLRDRGHSALPGHGG